MEISLLTISIVIFVLCFIALVFSVVFIILYCKSQAGNVSEDREQTNKSISYREISKSNQENILDLEEELRNSLEDISSKEVLGFFPPILSNELDSEESNAATPPKTFECNDNANDSCSVVSDELKLKNDHKVKNPHKLQKHLAREDKGTKKYSMPINNGNEYSSEVCRLECSPSKKSCNSLVNLVAAHYQMLSDEHSHHQYISLESIYSLQENLSLEKLRSKKAADSVSIGEETSSLSSFSVSPTTSKMLSADDLRRLKQKIRLLQASRDASSSSPILV